LFSAVRRGVGEFAAPRVKLVGEVDELGAGWGCSRRAEGEAEIVGPMTQKLAGKGLETSDAGSYHSRRRVSTAGAEDPLPIVRLPE
jgi:hypothetical protein